MKTIQYLACEKNTGILIEKSNTTSHIKITGTKDLRVGTEGNTS
jgi:hypothetical protein